MKKIDLGRTISILANVGVIGGLIFVGMQLRQDRELGAIDRRLALAESAKYWAELLTENSEVWAKGISGETLTPAETIAFESLAEAQEADLFNRWANIGSEAFSNASEDVLARFRQGIVRRAAREYYSNPGLLSWYREFQDELREIGEFGRYDELVDEEIDRLLIERDAE